ncbi:MAG: AraC family transcriptional regulator [Paenibacillus sp.]|nr:AraC family transcriptional regulator [Paenibacillus sp.]
MFGMRRCSRELQTQGGKATEPNLAAQAVRYMEERYAEPITLNSLASIFQCNARQLQRLFKARLQIGPMDYLIQIRMRNAKAMLLRTDVPLQHIAEAVGYTDSYYFSRMFTSRQVSSKNKHGNRTIVAQIHPDCRNLPLLHED